MSHSPKEKGQNSHASKENPGLKVYKWCVSVARYGALYSAVLRSCIWYRMCNDIVLEREVSCRRRFHLG